MITPVILCGGSGSRLWPLSRSSYPKQLLPLIDSKSLLQQTVLRVRDVPDMMSPIILCNQAHRFIVAEQLRDIGCENYQIILEPEGKNTAPAITLAALHRQADHQHSLLLTLPADHVVDDQASFNEAILQAAKMADRGSLVTFGVTPTRPETGYGYIKKGEPIESQAFRVRQFVEKPDANTAQKFLDSGEYFWNSGMFMFYVDAFLRELEKYSADILACCRDCLKGMIADLDFYRIPPELFRACRGESIDYAVMEKSDNIVVVPLHSGWNDVGSWSAVWDTHAMDQAGNVLKGDVVAYQVSNSYLHAESRLLAAVGVSDLAVIETADAVLVANKNNAQHIKTLVEMLAKNNRSEVERHRRDYRPWGHYEVLHDGADFKVKHLVVKPGAKLSLQMHQHRSEHWIVIKGTAFVTCGETQFELQENQSTFIPAKEKHRLENRGEILLELIEVQTGTYFGEDDIVRFADIYQR